MSRIIIPRDDVRIFETASCVGNEEFKGPLGDKFDFHDESDKFGEKTWEMAEGGLAKTALNLALAKAKLSPEKIDVLFAGDLQNQCVASSCGLAEFAIPYVGLYGACSTLGEGLISAASMLSCGEYDTAAVVTTSHNCASERQFRLPIEYGGQRTPTAQWTATAGGAFLLTKQRGYAKISAFMLGTLIDAGISDPNNMGAAMAPAAADSIRKYFASSEEKPSDFDVILTGDLAKEGSEILENLLSAGGLRVSNHMDCGKMLYDYEKQDVHSGGSGCGCSAAVFSAHFLPLLKEKKINKMLLIPTGAMMSPSSVQQGNNIIGLAPIIRIEAI